MKIAVVGANGQLGSDVVEAFTRSGDEVFPLNHSDIDVTSMDSALSRLKKLHPDVVVNTAAMHHVENCELDPNTAFAVNGLGARNLSVIVKDLGAVLMHVSTDYVFDGRKQTPYEECDAPNPLNVYGNTKLSGEHFVSATTDRYFVLRTSAIYGKNPCRAKGGLNFVQLMLKLARERGRVCVVDTEIVTPTSTAELPANGRTEPFGRIWLVSRNSGGQLFLVRLCATDL